MNYFIQMMIVFTALGSGSAFASCFEVKDQHINRVGTIELPVPANKVCVNIVKNFSGQTYRISFSEAMSESIHFNSATVHNEDCQGFCRTFRATSGTYRGKDFKMRNGLITFHVPGDEGVIAIGYDTYPIRRIK